MAAFVRCEQCKREAPVTSVGFITMPAGWVTVSEAKTGPDTKHEFCGLTCAARWAVDLAEARAAAEKATAAEQLRGATGPELVQ